MPLYIRYYDTWGSPGLCAVIAITLLWGVSAWYEFELVYNTTTSDYYEVQRHYIFLLSMEIVYHMLFSYNVIEPLWAVLPIPWVQKVGWSILLAGVALFRVYNWARYRIAWHKDKDYFREGFPLQLCSAWGLTSKVWKEGQLAGLGYYAPALLGALTVVAVAWAIPELLSSESAGQHGGGNAP